MVKDILGDIIEMKRRNFITGILGLIALPNLFKSKNITYGYDKQHSQNLIKHYRQCGNRAISFQPVDVKWDDIKKRWYCIYNGQEYTKMIGK